MTEAPTEAAAPTKRARGRPRDAAARQRVLEAARELLAEGGAEAVTMAALAARAQVGRPTIYRSWPNARAVALAALADGAGDLPAPEGIKARRDLRRALAALAASLSGPAARGAAGLLGHEEFRDRFVGRSRAALRAALETGQANGQIRRKVDLDAACDLMLGPLLLRLATGAGAVDDAFAETIVDLALDGIGK